MIQIKMAKRLGISQGQLSRFLAGVRVGLKTLETIAASLSNGHDCYALGAMPPDQRKTLLEKELAADES